jgi:hypothetical protein
MYQKENPTQVRILEMYASKAAYEQHLKTPHFQKYKTTTLKMVKSLKLVDMQVIDLATMSLIFRKFRQTMMRNGMAWMYKAPNDRCLEFAELR